MARILVVGVMRAGKSTVAEALGRLDGVEVVEEPDNPRSRPFAIRVKRRLGQRYFPSFAPGEPAPEYELLWRHAFGAPPSTARPYSIRERVQRRLAWKLLLGAGGDDVLRAVSGAGAAPLGWRLRVAAALAIPERPQRPSDHVVVTASEPLSAEWVADRLDAAVVVVVRDPLAVLSSWAQLDWLGGAGHDMLDKLDARAAAAGAEAVGVPLPRAGSPPLVRAAWLAGLLTWHLRGAARRNPACHAVIFEQLTAQPLERLREVAEALGLTWRDDAANPVRARTPGPAGEGPDDVRPEPSAEELVEARALLDEFPRG
jgi:hypothetical protein